MSAPAANFTQQESNSSEPNNEGASSNGQQGKAQNGNHKRIYQACIPCRRRKVRCDLGSVDNPSDPPCVRCRRESKECFFSATRRKRKTDGSRENSADPYEFGDDYIVRNGRKMVGSGSPPATLRQSSMGAPMSARSTGGFPESANMNPGPPLTPGGSIGRHQPLRRPQSETRQQEERSADEHVENLEAQEVMRREVYGPHDALDLLYKAATDSPGHKRQRLDGNEPTSPRIGHGRNPSVNSYQGTAPRHTSFPVSHMRQTSTRSEGPIDPALSSDGVLNAEKVHDAGYKDAIKAWSRFRFVRAGWFTAPEAIEYITYYYEFLSPLTPISPPTFRNPETHPTLLIEEPILTVTLLTISSRYKQISGTGGHCRSYAIHEQLWTYLRGMIERCLWGQEAFGGGFCGSGADLSDAQTSSTAPWRGLRKGSLRTLGTIESLMILTEWHPRALHFPPAEATDELMLPTPESLDPYSTDDESAHRQTGGVGGRRIESWLEPAWRSDRMCWMLLSTAMGLGYELGVFDDIEELLEAGGEMTRPEYNEETYRLRATRIKRLLLIYVTQLAGRLGWTNMVPENLRKTDPAFAPRKRRASIGGKTPETNTTVTIGFNYIPDLEMDDRIIHCWAGISNAMRIGNEKLFKSRQYTTMIIQDGSYTDLLKDFQPMLSSWKREFDRFQLPLYIQHILSIEYEYVRIYVNSLSLQAVVERCTSNATNRSSTTNGPTASAMSPETQNYFGKLPLARIGGFGAADQGYVREVVEGCRNLLRTVVEGLLPNDYLKHAPVRTYFRIISGAMFLLKTFALGASKHDVEISISLMDSTVDALRNCVVDDVHLGIRFADLLETLTSRLRSRFISAPEVPLLSREARETSSRTRTPAPLQEPDAKRQRRDPGDQIREWNDGTPNYSGMHTSTDLNVSATPYDVNQGDFYVGNNYNHSQGVPFNSDLNHLFGVGDNNDWVGGNDEMWYLPPGPAFYQDLNNQAITQTADGVNVGGMDLLDYMTLDTNFHADGQGL
ncbi:zinc finger transcriptional activator [Clarireedia jacksonii]